MGGSGFSLEKRLLPEVESCFPDYALYRHRHYALGYLTRGCSKRCPFCLVPRKEGTTKTSSASFDDFVPKRQRNVMLLDDNLLSYPGADALLAEMAGRGYAVNFSLYYRTFGRYYLPLLRVIYRYNNKPAICRFLRQPELLTSDLYRSYEGVEKP